MLPVMVEFLSDAGGQRVPYIVFPMIDRADPSEGEVMHPGKLFLVIASAMMLVSNAVEIGVSRGSGRSVDPSTVLLALLLCLSLSFLLAKPRGSEDHKQDSEPRSELRE